MRKGRGLRCDGCRASMPAVQATVTATDLLCPACALAGPATPLAAHKPRAIGAEPVGPSGRVQRQLELPARIASWKNVTLRRLLPHGISYRNEAITIGEDGHMSVLGMVCTYALTCGRRSRNGVQGACPLVRRSRTVAHGWADR